MKISLTQLRKNAEQAVFQFAKWAGNKSPIWSGGRCHPAVVLNLLDRIKELEERLDAINSAAEDRRWD